jgi:hypothetical protein
MNLRKSVVFFYLAFVLSLASCSGQKNSCTTNCGGGNAGLTISMFDTPPAGVDLLSFTLPIAGISLTPSSGSSVPITTVSSVEATRLQTDSAMIAVATSVPAGTYTSLSVTLGPTSATSNVFINTSGSTITFSGGSCASGAVCNMPAGAIATISLPISLTLTANQSQWMGLNLDLKKAISTNGGLSVDFTQTGVLTTVTSARTGLPTNAMDTIEDFIGKVTALSTGSITVKSDISGQSITATLTTDTEYDTPVTPSTAYSNCTTASSCIQVGSTVSLDATLNSGGVLTATELDVLDATAVDEVEGVIYPTSTVGVYGLILADKISASGNAVLASTTTTYGTGIFLDVTSASYFVDTKTLTGLFTPVGFPGTGLLAGQVVRAKVSNVASTSNGITATASNVLLRFSRITGTVTTVAGTNFNITPPSYVSALNPTLPASPLAYTFSGTAFDGITGTGDSNFGNSATASIRTLLLNNTAPTFAVAKVRVP